jgi:hypothetical protein
MSTRLLFVVLSLVAALLAARTSRADAPRSGAACFLERHYITQVRPYYAPRQPGSAVRHLVGAEVRLAPQLNLTDEWLRQGVSEQLEATREAGSRGCLDDVGRVVISADPHGDGVSVRLLAREASDAEQVVGRARALVSPCEAASPSVAAIGGRREATRQ